mgnify:CR=1 FL=1|jgi:Skp family chaperone for outer membrane proteins
MTGRLHRARIGWGIIAVALTLLLPLAAQSQQSAVRIFSLSQERLFAGSEFGIRVRSDVTRQSTEIGSENRRIEAELKEEEQALTDERATLSPAEFRVLADAFDLKVEAIRTEQAQKSADLNAFAESEQQRFFDSIFPVLVALAEELSATAILDERSTIIASEQMDITGLAVQRVNEVIGDGTQASDP